jgi:hypothetical protein
VALAPAARAAAARPDAVSAEVRRLAEVYRPVLATHPHLLPVPPNRLHTTIACVTDLLGETN